MKNIIKNTLIDHARAAIAKHKINVEILMDNPQGVAEHPDIMATIEKEIEIISKYDDQIDVLKRHF